MKSTRDKYFKVCLLKIVFIFKVIIMKLNSLRQVILPLLSAVLLTSLLVDILMASQKKSCCHTPSSRASLLASVSPTMAASKDLSGMVWIPGGEFSMGGVGPEARPDEFPVHQVKVDGFWM